MSQLQVQLDALEAQEEGIRRKRRTEISTAKRDFYYLQPNTHRHHWWGGDRYFILRADGRPMGYGWRQRPTAIAHFKRAAVEYSNNVYFFDRRSGEVIDIDGKVVFVVSDRA